MGLNSYGFVTGTLITGTGIDRPTLCFTGQNCYSVWSTIVLFETMIIILEYEYIILKRNGIPYSLRF